MPRIPFPKLEDAPKEYQEQVAKFPALRLNILSMWSHAPATIELAALWGRQQFTSLALSPAERELVILVTGACAKSEYEVAQHVPMALQAGCSKIQVEQVVARGAEPEFPSNVAEGVFNEKETVLLKWIRAVAAGPVVSDELMDPVKQLYTNREITEALTLHGFYYMLARLTTVLEIPIDEDGSFDGLKVLSAMSSLDKK
ncbi:AhpD-like protein [Naematelia encephala]|uniref:AhpD-like protein n=1 Tax=Naematelia encephala TaxID=71784 RepID=A0A1Y2AW17_9TREE|nr:AhpD-like protein [Naematelia encephala]